MLVEPLTLCLPGPRVKIIPKGWISPSIALPAGGRIETGVGPHLFQPCFMSLSRDRHLWIRSYARHGFAAHEKPKGQKATHKTCYQICVFCTEAQHIITSFSVSDQYSDPGLCGRACGPTSLSAFATKRGMPDIASRIACPFGTSLQARLSHGTSPAEIRMPVRDVFDDAQQQIYHLIDTDALPRWLQDVHAQMQVRYE